MENKTEKISDITYMFELIPSYYELILDNEGSLVTKIDRWLLGINSRK